MSRQQSRRRNYNEPGHAHELTFSCYRRFPFLAAERTCGWLADAIDEARIALQFDMWAYVFMPEHVHLIINPNQAQYNIADIRSAIKGPVGRRAIAYLSVESPRWIARVTRKRGAKTERLFWQSGGGFDRNVTEPNTLMHMIDYIHMNPVRRGLVEMPAQWKWSSAAWFADGQNGPLRIDAIPAEWLGGLP